MSCLTDPDDEYLTEHAYTEARAKADREDAKVRRLIAAPLTRYHAEFFAARVICTLTAKEPLGSTNSHVRYLVRAAFTTARFRAKRDGFTTSGGGITESEFAMMDVAAKKMYRLERNQCRRQGKSVSRQRLPGGTSRQHARAS